MLSPPSAIPGLPLESVLPTLPDFTKLLPGPGKTPADRRLPAADDGRDLRGGEPFQIAEDQDRAVRDRHLCQDELDFLGQLGLDPGVRIGEFERHPALAAGPVDGCRWGRLATDAPELVQSEVHPDAEQPGAEPPRGVEAIEPAVDAPESLLGQVPCHFGI